MSSRSEKSNFYTFLKLSYLRAIFSTLKKFQRIFDISYPQVAFFHYICRNIEVITQ